MRGPRPYGDGVQRTSDGRPYVVTGQRNQHFDDEDLGITEGYLADLRRRESADNGMYPRNPDSAVGGREASMGHTWDSGMRDPPTSYSLEADRAGRNDGNDLPTLRKSRTKLKAELGALDRKYPGTDRVKAMLICRLMKIEDGIWRIESGEILGKDWRTKRSMPCGRVEANIAEAEMATMTRDMSRLDVESREGAKIPGGKGALTRHRAVEDYDDEESDYQPRGSRHSHKLPPGGYNHPGLEDYADEKPHYQPRGSSHSHRFPPAGHSRPGSEDYTDEESDYQPRSSRHGRYPPPAGHGRRVGR